MPMPIWFRLASIEENISSIFENELIDIFLSFDLELRWATPLIVDKNTQEVDYIVDELDRVETISDVIDRAKGYDGVSLEINIRSIRRSVTFVLFTVGDATILCVEVERAAILEEYGSWGKGGWILNFMSKICNRLEILCAGSSSDKSFSQVYSSLEPTKFLSEFRAGNLFLLSPPTFMLFRESFLGMNEIGRLLEKEPINYQTIQDGEINVVWRLE